jgi:acetyltransferase-like isoleucine patch superfamily enzyme
MSGRELLKRGAHAAAWLAVTPSVASWRLRSGIVGPDRAIESSMEAWALIPGLPGQYLRRAFLARVLPSCSRSAVIGFGTLLSSAQATIADNAYIGPRCHLGWVHIETAALLGAGVHVPSGGQTHGFADPTVPIRDQPGIKRAVRIGAGAWIGSGAVVLADVGAGTVVAAGAVVTKPLPPNVIAAGVPARIVRFRVAQDSAGSRCESYS